MLPILPSPKRLVLFLVLMGFPAIAGCGPAEEEPREVDGQLMESRPLPQLDDAPPR